MRNQSTKEKVTSTLLAAGLTVAGGLAVSSAIDKHPKPQSAPIEQDYISPEYGQALAKAKDVSREIGATVEPNKITEVEVLNGYIAMHSPDFNHDIHLNYPVRLSDSLGQSPEQSEQYFGMQDRDGQTGDVKIIANQFSSPRMKIVYNDPAKPFIKVQVKTFADGTHDYYEHPYTTTPGEPVHPPDGQIADYSAFAVDPGDQSNRLFKIATEGVDPPLAPHTTIPPYTVESGSPSN